MYLSKRLILASNSPRRKEILQNAGFPFVQMVKPTSEDFSISMPVNEVPLFLATQKLAEFEIECSDSLVLCADTVVVVNGEIINKPADEDEARVMLKKISGKSHKVITGVAIGGGDSILKFSDTSEVTFKVLTDEELNFYIKSCKPFDKAGAYGIQDFIGMVGITRIQGSFYTVMGLPIHKVYDALLPWIEFKEY